MNVYQQVTDMHIVFFIKYTEELKNAPPAEMLIYVENWIFSICEK